jgi:NTP pyrophosphatase (non-canonical NTP hydrolase)
MMTELNYEELIGQWHRDRNLIEGSTDKDQYLKLIQEAGELSDSLCKGKDIRDDVGDMMVVLINIMVRNNITMKDCLRVAYADIRDRKGKMIDGIFIKEGDT